jgi:hypothetical protein
MTARPKRRVSFRVFDPEHRSRKHCNTMSTEQLQAIELAYLAGLNYPKITDGLRRLRRVFEVGEDRTVQSLFARRLLRRRRRLRTLPKNSRVGFGHTHRFLLGRCLPGRPRARDGRWRASFAVFNFAARDRCWSERQKQPPPTFLSEIVQYWTALYPELADRYTSNLIVYQTVRKSG